MSLFMVIARYRRREDVAFRQLGEETLLVPIRSRPQEEMSVFALNEVAAFLWSSLDEFRTPEELAELLVRTFEVARERAAADVGAFLERLEAKQLVERAEG